MDEEKHQSADDALEDTRPDDMFHPTRDEEKLEGDEIEGPPATPPVDMPNTRIPEPLTDTDNQPEDIYDEGESEATNMAEREQDLDSANQPKPLEPEE